MNSILNALSGTEAGEIYANLPANLQGIFIAVIIGIVVVSIFAFGVSIYLAIRYVSYNRRDASCGLTGEEVARRVLDGSGCEDIKVTKSGSLLFGNSYSHFFKKVRLRRRTIEKKSVSAMAMGAQKAALAVLDREGDPDMKVRSRCVLIGTVGPIAFIPLIIVGAVLDVIINGGTGTFMLAAIVVGILFFAAALVFQLKTLSTERKAQDRACELLVRDGLATAEEIGLLRKLFRLYNIEYVNNIILSMLEVLYYVLQLVAAVNGGSISDSD